MAVAQSKGKSKGKQLTSISISTQELRVRAKRNTVVAVTTLWVAGCAAQDEVRVVVLVVGEAVVVAVQDDASVGAHNVHDWL